MSDPDAAMRAFEAQAASQDSVESSLEAVIDKASEVLLQHLFKRRAEQKTAQQVIESVTQAVELQLLGHDPGETGGSASLNPRWDAEEEPPACQIDRFARGMVPLRPRSSTMYQSFKRMGGSRPGTAVVESDAGSVGGSSVGSYRSRATRASKGGRSVSSKTRKEGGEGKGRKKGGALALEPYNIKQETNDDDKQRDRLRIEETRKLDKRRRLAEKLAENKRKADAEAERMRKLQEELKGKEFTFDQDGNVIVINPMNPNRIPAFAVEPKVNLRTLEDQKIQVEESPAKDKKKKKKSKKSKKGGESQPFLEKREAEPALLDMIKLQAGVTIRDTASGQTKAGEEPPRDPLSMTRTEYNALLDQTQEKPAVRRAVRTTKQRETTRFGQDVKVREGKTPARQQRQQLRQQQEQQRASRGPSRPVTRGSGTASPDRLSPEPTSPDRSRLSSAQSARPQTAESILEQLEAMKVETSMRGGMTNARGGRAGRRRLPGRGKRHFVKPLGASTAESKYRSPTPGEVDEEELDKFNRTLMEDSSWGQSRGGGGGAMLRPRPLKPLANAKGLVKPQRTRVARDPTAATLAKTMASAKSPKTKLPAPMYPAAKGHGMIMDDPASPSQTRKKKAKRNPNEVTVSKDISKLFGRRKK